MMDIDFGYNEKCRAGTVFTKEQFARYMANGPEQDNSPFSDPLLPDDAQKYERLLWVYYPAIGIELNLDRSSTGEPDIRYVICRKASQKGQSFWFWRNNAEDFLPADEVYAENLDGSGFIPRDVDFSKYGWQEQLMLQMKDILDRIVTMHQFDPVHPVVSRVF